MKQHFRLVLIAAIYQTMHAISQLEERLKPLYD